jgi:hypothetical protein
LVGDFLEDTIDGFDDLGVAGGFSFDIFIIIIILIVTIVISIL